MKKILLFASVIGMSLFNAQTTNVYSFGFDAAFPVDWTSTNQSTPLGASTWVKAPYTLPLANPSFGSGNTTTLPSGQAGGSNSFAIVNFNSTTGGNGTISNWLITSNVSVKDGDVVSFYTRKGTDGTADYADRLELRYSTAATTVIPSGGSAGLGTFTNVGTTVNPNLATGFVYPQTWTQYSFTVAGVGGTPIPVRFAFRYFVTAAGPTGTNSDLIGIDSFSVDRSNLSVSDLISKKSDIAIYPNPTSDFINLKTDAKVIKIEVFDVAGKNVNTPLQNNQFDVRGLPSGQYLITIETSEGKSTEKFIKK